MKEDTCYIYQVISNVYQQEIENRENQLNGGNW